MIALRAPLRISGDRVVLYGVALAIVASFPFLVLPQWFHDVAVRGDFANFWSAGANAGTAALLDPARLAVWQRAHGITPQAFVYPPGFAWFYTPFSHFAPLAAMTLEESAMAAVAVVAGLIAAATFPGFTRGFAVLATLSWGPMLSAIELGQNTAVALLLVFAAIWSLVERRQLLTGAAVGVLLYKPSLALPFVVLLALRRQWRALGVVAACAMAWYFLSVLATHGDWGWMRAYVSIVQASNAADFPGNVHKAYTIPTLLLGIGVPTPIALAVAAAAFIAAAPLMVRLPALEAGSMTALVGIATSIHAWPYEAALLLPAIFYAMLRIAEPWRTPLVGAAYGIAALALILPHAGHALALLPIGGLTLWLWDRYK